MKAEVKLKKVTPYGWFKLRNVNVARKDYLRNMGRGIKTRLITKSKLRDVCLKLEAIEIIYAKRIA